MKLALINTVNELDEHFRFEFSKIRLGVELKFYGNFSSGTYVKENLKRNVARAILDAFDDYVDIIVICTDRPLGDFDFMKPLGDAEFYYLNDRSIADLRASTPVFVNDLRHLIDSKLYRMYEATGCGCSACRDLK